MSASCNARPNARSATELSFPELYTEEDLEKRRQTVARVEGSLWQGVDATDPKCPAGDAGERGVDVGHCRTHRRTAMDVKP